MNTASQSAKKLKLEVDSKRQAESKQFITSFKKSPTNAMPRQSSDSNIGGDEEKMEVQPRQMDYSVFGSKNPGAVFGKPGSIKLETTG